MMKWKRRSDQDKMINRTKVQDTAKKAEDHYASLYGQLHYTVLPVSVEQTLFKRTTGLVPNLAQITPFK